MASGGTPTFEEQFAAFSKFGDTKSDGKTITLTQADKWFKQAKVIGGTKITATDTGIAFGKFKARTINKDDFMKYLNDLASQKKMDVNKLLEMLCGCGAPGTAGTTGVSSVGGVDRLTDTSKYTGAHKERFDESGKGKGIEGRENVADKSGYVGGYKDKDTYDKKH